MFYFQKKIKEYQPLLSNKIKEDHPVARPWLIILLLQATGGHSHHGCNHHPAVLQVKKRP
jgi:hypothetical protein